MSNSNNVKDSLVKLLTGKSIDCEPDVDYVADFLIENGVTILPEGAIVLTRAEIEALDEYQKKLNEGVITNTENKSNNSADMSNKQIEEMAKHCHFYEEGKCLLLEDEAVKCDTKCDMCEFAKRLYSAGYRKASDVAEEIFAEIEKEIELALDSNYKVKRDAQDDNDSLVSYVEGKITCLRGLLGFLAELKKKYTEDKGRDKLAEFGKYSPLSWKYTEEGK